DIPLKILDFGAGFCVTANHYSKRHIVTAVEPNEEMIKFSIQDNHFDLIHGGIEVLRTYADHSFDVVLCHNVLEYVPDKERILRELARVLKPGGKLSIVKHNLMGKVIAYAVYSDNPNAALHLLESGDDEKNLFGNRDTYDDDFIVELVRKYGLSSENIFGIRTFFALSKNNDIKFTQEWYDNMLALEMRTCDLHEYNNFSFFHHLIFKKKE
ncbi:MAG: class I SAM-dependent methyltransferase, partial [Oscillospiraceae bacterium]|nr:class I SAM-dependent methyltransferase [Oscillospiraceae bacterium]